jgi:hypothetical protein
MTVPFGIAAGALLRGELTDAWIAPLRRWTLVPWMFLTVGIILGSWWAYAVLGWGGYWAWDPVENASFHPWLTATAYMHSSMVLERKRNLKLWTLALALGTFWLTIVGTFIRQGHESRMCGGRQSQWLRSGFARSRRGAERSGVQDLFCRNARRGRNAGAQRHPAR